MMSLELLLAKSPSEWSEEDWKLVRDAIQTGDITLDRLARLGFPPTPLAPITPWQAGTPIPFKQQNVQPFDYQSVRFSQPCSIVEFFKRNPESKVAMISCNCPTCSVWCSAG